MRALESVFAIFCAVMIVFGVPVIMRAEQAGDSLEVCAEAGVEEVCSDISADGSLSLLRVQEMTQVLMNCGYAGEFEITVYTYEDAADGNIHQYAVTWEEILMVLDKGEDYIFPKDCYVRVEVPGIYPDNLLERFMYGRKKIEKPIVLGSGKK